jgi:hypothetical protein
MDIEEKISDLERQFSELKDAFKQQEDVVELTFRKAAEVWQILCDRTLMLEQMMKKNCELMKNNSEITLACIAEFEELRKPMMEHLGKLEPAAGGQKIGPLSSQTGEGEA